MIDEAKKDHLFSSLLLELRTARDLNRQLCLELHKANMKLHLNQQHSAEHQPGSMAGTSFFLYQLLDEKYLLTHILVLVRKLYETHHIRSDVLSSWNSIGEHFCRKGSSAPNKVCYQLVFIFFE